MFTNPFIVDLLEYTRKLPESMQAKTVREVKKLITPEEIDALKIFVNHQICERNKKRSLPDFNCKDCGVDTGAIDEYYMVLDAVWIEAGGGKPHRGLLCIGCLEKRLGRQLRAYDFLDCPLNHMTKMSARLRSRVGGRYVKY